MSRTQALLRLEIAHGYFADGRCRGLRFEPAEGTAHRLRRADVLAREDGASLWLLGPADAAERLLEDDPAPLTWLVRATEAHFALYTADPAKRPRELVLLQATDDEAVTVRVVPVAQPGQPGVSEPDVALHLPGEAAWRPPFALLRLPVDLLRPLAPPPTSGDPATATSRASMAPPHPRHLQWTLPPRAIVWKYCLFGDWPEDALDVHDPDGDISFHPPSAERMDDGRPLLALRSRAPIALAERSPARLQLRCRQAGLPKVLVKRLPVPGPQHLAREEIDGAATLVSEIHVHR